MPTAPIGRRERDPRTLRRPVWSPTIPPCGDSALVRSEDLRLPPVCSLERQRDRRNGGLSLPGTRCASQSRSPAGRRHRGSGSRVTTRRLERIEENSTPWFVHSKTRAARVRRRSPRQSKGPKRCLASRRAGLSRNFGQHPGGDALLARAAAVNELAGNVPIAASDVIAQLGELHFAIRIDGTDAGVRWQASRASLSRNISIGNC